MAIFKAYSSNVEVNGETVLSVVNGVGVFKKQSIDILAKNGINDPKPGEWYSQQAWLDSFKEISEKIGAKTLNVIGKAIPANAKFPPDIDNIDKGLSAIDMAYHMNHRGGEIGHYTYTKTGDNSGKMVCTNPYPCEFDMGIIEAMAERFLPSDSIMVTVEHTDSHVCRKTGAESCTYVITW
ncbi:MAG TPA: hypothetical protein DEP72_09400 [Clostridiales bacterium]|nr:MAG: hypothetical protein A2Y18_04010 [Clostridiales bacterium GWD2_32_19]HCC08356.1 hypothetical protein [Clostridiales bacterium]